MCKISMLCLFLLLAGGCTRQVDKNRDLDPWAEKVLQIEEIKNNGWFPVGVIGLECGFSETGYQPRAYITTELELVGSGDKAALARHIKADCKGKTVAEARLKVEDLAKPLTLEYQCLGTHSRVTLVDRRDARLVFSLKGHKKGIYRLGER